MASQDKKPAEPTVETKSLTFAFPDGSSGLREVTLDLPASSRTLLIGGELNHPVTFEQLIHTNTKM